MNKKLAKIFLEDQKERKNWQSWGKTVPIEEVQKRDKERLNAVLQMIKNGKLVTGRDYWQAAMVLQHGKKAEHYKLANRLCLKAIESGEKNARWLYAASFDRLMVNSGEKYQKYGTQFRKNNKNKWELWPIDPGTTDKMRAEYDVPSLKKIKN